MRAMWHEFPNDAVLYPIQSQFMFGDSYLVAPKITEPTPEQTEARIQPVDYLLPTGNLWYNTNTGIAEEGTSTWSHVEL
jgi:alpha-D-xyloside xylohydrolase